MARKEKKYHFIYKTTNLLSGKYYIGMHSTHNLEDGYMGSGKRLRRSLNKYGKQNHKVEILEFVSSREELKKREEEIVSLNEIAKEDCMNLKVGGQGGFINEEQQRKRSIAANKKLNYNLQNDILFYKNWKEKLVSGLKNAYATGKKNKNWGNKNKGGTLSETHKQKIGKTNSVKQSGILNSQFGTYWISKDGNIKKIKREEFDNYNKQGWLRGKKN